MNKDKVLNKINKKYGTTDIDGLTINKIKNLKVNQDKLKGDNKKFKLIRKGIKGLVKGASAGIGVAGVINTIFPNAIPVLGGYLVGLSNTSTIAKIAGLSLLSSKPFGIISNFGIIAVGAAVGALTYGGYKLVKSTTNNLQIINNRSKIKKINKGKK